MKAQQQFVACYEEFLAQCSSVTLPLIDINIKKYLLFEKPGIFENLPFGSGLIDYTSGRFLHLSNNTEEILSYKKEDYEYNIDFLYNKMLLEDRHVFNERIFPDILGFLVSVPHNQYNRYLFSFTYRYFRKDGVITNLLQYSNFLEPDRFGRPMLNRFIFFDISYYKRDACMSLTISKANKGKGYIPISKKSYYSLSKPHISSRELEILKLSQQGLSSKLIADKLFLSIHTVKNHKRNMMEKTSSKNISELINFALNRSLLV